MLTLSNSSRAFRRCCALGWPGWRRMVDANAVTLAAMLLSLALGAGFVPGGAAVRAAVTPLLPGWSAGARGMNAVDGMLARVLASSRHWGRI